MRIGMDIGTVGTLALSVASSVSIIICNKILLSTYKFHFESTLTCWHFVVTLATLHVARLFKQFEHRPLNKFSVMKFGFVNGISVGLMNLTLGYNSVGFYQMAKLAIIPFTVFIEMVFYGKKFRSGSLKFGARNLDSISLLPLHLIAQVYALMDACQQIHISILILLIGVGITTVTDLQLNFMGCVLSFLAIATTCIAQIMTGRIQKNSGVSAIQLLYQACPYQAGTLFCIGPIVEKVLTKQSFLTFDYTRHVLLCIVLSCFISVAVNISTFLVIGKTSPVTFQVLGHLKTCLVLVFGYTLFNNPVNWRNIIGLSIAVIGMVLYSSSSNDAPQMHASFSRSVGSSSDTISLSVK